MSTKQHAVGIRSNMRFEVDYGNSKLEPEAEIILLIQEPTYTASAKTGVIKRDVKIVEARFLMKMNAINRFIGELQTLAAGLQRYDQLAGAINLVIDQSKKVEQEQTP